MIRLSFQNFFYIGEILMKTFPGIINLKCSINQIFNQTGLYKLAM